MKTIQNREIKTSRFPDLVQIVTISVRKIYGVYSTYSSRRQEGGNQFAGERVFLHEVFMNDPRLLGFVPAWSALDRMNISKTSFDWEGMAASEKKKRKIS